MKTNTMADKRRIVSAAFALAGWVLYLVCFPWHTCFDGHLAHPPYSIWPYVNDGAWVLLLTCAAVFVWKSNMYLKAMFSTCVGVLILYNWQLITRVCVPFRFIHYIFLAALLFVFVSAIIALHKGRKLNSEENI